jgi:glucokinase
MSASSQCVLVVDVGATNARFATSKNGVLGAITNFKVADFPSFVAALHTYYRQNAPEQPVHQAMVAVAGPVIAVTPHLQTLYG